MAIKTMYVTEDGKTFDTEKSAKEHQKKLEELNSPMNKFLSSNSGKRLLSKYKLTDCALWMIKNADTNPDLFGSHCTQVFACFNGSLKLAIEYALTFDKFYCYDYGDIVLCQNYAISHNHV
ncbi:MAG: hypothetical protein ACTTIS_00240 [Streptobacillus sp.]